MLPYHSRRLWLSSRLMMKNNDLIALPDCPAVSSIQWGPGTDFVKKGTRRTILSRYEA